MGNFKTYAQTKISFLLPHLQEKRLITWQAHVTNAPMSYNMIIGQDCLAELGIDIKFSSQTIEWDGTEIPMKNTDDAGPASMHIDKSKAVKDATSRIKQILDAKYEPADLDQIVRM